MRLDVHIVNFAFAGGPATYGPTIARAGALAEQAGVASMSFIDHYLQMEYAGLGPPTEPMLEGPALG